MYWIILMKFINSIKDISKSRRHKYSAKKEQRRHKSSTFVIYKSYTRALFWGLQSHKFIEFMIKYIPVLIFSQVYNKD